MRETSVHNGSHNPWRGSCQESPVRETRTPGSLWRGVETGGRTKRNDREHYYVPVREVSHGATPRPNHFFQKSFNYPLMTSPKSNSSEIRIFLKPEITKKFNIIPVEEEKFFEEVMKGSHV